MKNAESNKCFKLKVWPHNNSPWISKYQPFTNSKREIEITCGNFSHLKTLRVR